MRFASLNVNGAAEPVVISQDGKNYCLLTHLIDGFRGDLVAYIAHNVHAGHKTPEPTQWTALADHKLLAPIPVPRRNVFCVGKNYHEHAKEFAQSGFDTSAVKDELAPSYPVIFTKAPSTVVADQDVVHSFSNLTQQLDYEAELAIIIGKHGRGISKADALDHVWGYTIVNDVTARDLQQKHRQWFLGKSMDTFCPMGPWIVTSDEIGDSANLDVRCWINGELRQDANTKDLIFDIPTIIESISAGMTLHPGDVIATGTPAGVGIGFKPPRFLKPGDEMKISIEKIGTLTNRISA